VTYIFLVRHAMTVWHKEFRYAGSSDVGLAPEGYVQADRLAEWARKADLDAVWCSPLSQARLTAAPSASVTRIEPHSRLLKTRHIVMTPHIAGASKQTAEKAARIAAREVRRFLNGERLEHCLNPRTKLGW
jgi:broad specificity phosphatase PhoE